MKQETKELIKWILDILYTHKIDLEISDVMPSENFDKATDFLFSLPEIESHLCRGGYIQDRNGTPCKTGDKVIINNSCTGTLKWDSFLFKFVAEICKEGTSFCYRTEISRTDIEKVKE